MDRPNVNDANHLKHRRSYLRQQLFWIVIIATSAAAALCLTFVLSAWTKFETDLTTYHGAKIGMTKIEAQYALDAPQTVQGPETEGESDWTISSPLRVNPLEENTAIPDGYDPIPDGKSAMDYDSWHFWSKRGSFDLDFDAKSHRVERIACYSENTAACDTLFGISIGSSEDEVLNRLGTPNKQEIVGGGTIMGSPVQVAKSMEYNSLGLHLVLAKKAVTGISKRPARNVRFWWWFTHGRV